MIYNNQKLIAHSGFKIDSNLGHAQAANQDVPFAHWFWEGGFLTIISYVIIIWGTGVLIKWFFEKKS